MYSAATTRITAATTLIQSPRPPDRRDGGAAGGVSPAVDRPHR